MPMGFVYVLVNPSMPDLVKIGLTINTSEERAAELRTTGVPSKFVVVYDELVSDCKLVERNTHARFAEFREHGEREFFRMPIKLAVKGLREEAAKYLLPDSAFQNRCEILDKLRHRFPKCIASNLSSVAVIQVTDSDAIARYTEHGDEYADGDEPTTRLLLLQTGAKPARDQHEIVVEQIDLRIILGIEKAFPPERDIRESGAAFVKNLNLATLIAVTESVLSDEGRAAAILDYNGGKPEDPGEPIDPADEDKFDRIR